jgi:hypothetical protein
MLQEVLDQISLEVFQHKHMELLKEMLYSQEYEYPVSRQSIPNIGYIAMLGNEPLAAGFLRRVECDIIAQIDGLVSNKAFGSVLRHKGIDLVVDQLILDTKSLKIQGLIAFTHDEGVLKRAKARGFKVLSESLISLTIPQL